MGITVSLRDEEANIVGRPVCDTGDLLHELLPVPDDESYTCLRFVDWYGDTIFNRPQMDTLIRELERVAERASPPGKLLALRIKRLAERCRDRPHHYIWFVGD